MTEIQKKKHLKRMRRCRKIAREKAKEEKWLEENKIVIRDDEIEIIDVR